MSKRLIALLVTGILLLGLTPSCVSTATSGTGLVEGNRVGNLAYDFSLQDTSGNMLTLSSLLGQPVMLNFWSTACPYCVEEFPLIQSKYNQEAPKASGVVILTLNIRESSQEITDFMDAHGYSMPVLLDTDAGVALQYGVSGIPTTFFIDRAGVIKYIKRGEFLSLSELQNDLNKIA